MSDGSIEYDEPVLVDVIKKEIEESMKNVQATLMNKITDVDGVRSSNIAEVKCICTLVHEVFTSHV